MPANFSIKRYFGRFCKCGHSLAMHFRKTQKHVFEEPTYVWECHHIDGHYCDCVLPQHPLEKAS